MIQYIPELMDFVPRKLRFKAWNQETKLLMRLNSIDCIKGELVRKDHILLQFSGLCDKHGEEIYEMDIVLIGKNKFVVVWDTDHNGWGLSTYPGDGQSLPFLKQGADEAIRLCSYFESGKLA